MKKILSLCLILVMLLSITSCGGSEETTASDAGETTTDTTQTSVTTDTTQTTETSGTQETVIPEDVFVSPDDEEKTTKTIVTENDDGMKMEVIIHGYKSESLGKEFYVKNNEFICIDAVITNNSEQIYKQFLPTYCHGSHTHEIDVDIADGNGHKLTDRFAFGACPEAIQIWEIAANGAQYGFKTKYVAGKYVWGNTDGNQLDIFTLYDSSIYTDGVCAFSGTVSFDYYPDEGDDETYKNTLTLKAGVAFDVVYQGDTEEEAKIGFVSPADEIKTTKTFMASNEDGLYLTFTVEGYASESLGEAFYLKSNELIQASVKIMNASTKKIYQTTAYYCHRNVGQYAPPECAHEFDFDIRYTSVVSEENFIWQPSASFAFPLNYEDFGCYHISKDTCWFLMPGDSFERDRLIFGAGYQARGSSYVDIYTYTYDDKAIGYSLYDAEDYEEGYATFKGTVSFDYSFEDGEKEKDDKTIACDVALKVFYVPTEN